MRFLFFFITFIGVVFVPNYSEAASKFCVKNIPFPRVKAGDIFSKEDNVTFDPNVVLVPEHIYYPPFSEWPLISTSIQVPTARDGYVQNKGRLIWGFDPLAYSLVGPYRFDYNFSDEDVVLDQDGSLLILGRVTGPFSYGLQVLGGGDATVSRLFRYDFIHEPQLLADSINKSLEWTSGIAGGLEFKVIFVNVHVQAEPGISNQSVKIIQGDDIFSSEIQDVSMTRYLPSYGVMAILGRDSLYLMSKDKKIILSQRLNSGDDYNGWGSISELEDNWLFIGGVQYNHAIHFQKNSEIWSVDNIVRIADKSNLAEDALRWAMLEKEQKERDGLSDIIRASHKLYYSPVLRKLFFYKDATVFKNGRLEKLPGNAQYDWPVGDVAYLNSAFFWGDDNSLYQYDGHSSHEVMGGDIDRGKLSVLPNLKRSFYSTFSGRAYELVAEDGKLTAVKLDLPGSEAFTSFFELPDTKEVFAVMGTGIYSFGEGKFTPVWVSNEFVGTIGKTVSNLNGDTKGFMFTTSDSKMNVSSLNWFGSCN